MAQEKAANGLTMRLLRMKSFIDANQLKPVTNPIYLDRMNFTPDGLLSNEIFGVSSLERRQRFAYIDLGGYHYLHPLAAMKLPNYDRRMADILYARKRFKLTKEGDLVPDDDGGTGPEFLYSIWGKVKVRDKTTESTKEIQKFFEKPRTELFYTEWPVIPAFYRDINTSEYNASKSTGIINSKYVSLISYSQSLTNYSAGFGSMTALTQARVQTILVDIYQQLMIKTVKGQPSKFGMLRRALAGKNLPYTARLVITAPNLQQDSVNRVPVRFGYGTIPLAYVCALFMPFMVHELKRFFDAEFIQRGKYEAIDLNGKPILVTFKESFDESQITAMINKFVNSPATRFDKVETPPTEEGVMMYMKIEGRFNKQNTTFSRPAAYTDILYIVAERVVKDKHVYITRYPVDNPYNQNPYRILISTTNKTEPVTIGDTVYEFYPINEGDPLNVFTTTAQFSNTMINSMNADFDVDFYQSPSSPMGTWEEQPFKLLETPKAA